MTNGKENNDFGGATGGEGENSPGVHNPANDARGLPEQPRLTEQDYVQFTGGKPRMTRLDYEADPLARLERNNRSTKQAIIYFITVPAVAIIMTVATAIASRVSGGPYCESDASAWLCTDGYQLFFYIAPAVWSFIGLFGAVYITYYKWSRHLRWRPWIAVIWFMMPITIGWTVNSGAMLAVL